MHAICYLSVRYKFIHILLPVGNPMDPMDSRRPTVAANCGK